MWSHDAVRREGDDSIRQGPGLLAPDTGSRVGGSGVSEGRQCSHALSIYDR